MNSLLPPDYVGKHFKYEEVLIHYEAHKGSYNIRIYDSNDNLIDYRCNNTATFYRHDLPKTNSKIDSELVEIIFDDIEPNGGKSKMKYSKYYYDHDGEYFKAKIII